MPDQAVWKQFRDFVIRIEHSGEDRYRVRGRTHDDREETATFEFPFDEKDLRIFLLKVGQPRRSIRRGRVPQPMQETQQFGQQLFNAITSGRVGQLLAGARHEADADGYGLRIQLRLSGARNLLNLPWEFLFDGREFLGLAPDTPIVRHLETKYPAQPMTVAPPLNMLVTISAPSDLQPLDVADEKEKLLDALSSMEADLRPAVTFTPDARLQTLQRSLRQAKMAGRPVHIWHYIGHGGYDPEQRNSFLLFTTRSGAPERVDPLQLSTLFSGYRELRLAVLNACEGARADTEDPFAGVATALVEQGIPAVIGMQFEISDQVATRFSSEFYTALAEGLPVDVAMTEARRAVFFMPNWQEWATPVLFMHTPNGQLFDFSTPRRAQEQRPARPDPPPRAPAMDDDALTEMWLDASAAYYTDRWEQATVLLERIVAARPDYRNAAQRLEHAQRMQRCAAIYQAGCQAMEQGAWEQASELLEQVVALEAGYADARGRLEESRRQARIEDMVREARQLAGAGHWRAVLRLLDQLGQIAPDHRETDDLREQANTALEAKQREKQAEALYRRGLDHLDQSQWAEAVDALSQVVDIFPGYKASAALLERARGEMLAAQPPRLVCYLVAEPDVISEGQSLKWKLRIHNAGLVDLADLRVYRDTTGVEGPFTLAAGRERSFSFTSNFTAAGEKVRTMTVRGKSALGAPVEVTVSATATVQPKKKARAAPKATPSVSVTVSPDAAMVQAGQSVTWTATVVNDGNIDLRRIEFERDNKPVETFSLAPGQSRTITSQSRYTTAGVKEKTITLIVTPSQGQKLFEAAVGTVEVMATGRRGGPPASDGNTRRARSASEYRAYIKELARENAGYDSIPCPICATAVSPANQVRHYDKVHAGQTGPVPESWSAPAPRQRQSKPAQQPTYRDTLKGFAREHRYEMVACPVCDVPVSTENILRHYDRQHPGAVGRQPSLDQPSATTSRETPPTSTSQPSAPALGPAEAYREWLKAEVRRFDSEEFVICPICEATTKASSLVRHYDKVHPNQYIA